MARITVEDCLKHVSNRFSLVILASKRVRQLLNGASARVESKNKPVVTALREIAAVEVRFKTDAEMEEDRLQRERAREEALAAAAAAAASVASAQAAAVSPPMPESVASGSNGSV